MGLIHFSENFILLCIELYTVCKLIRNPHSKLLKFGYEDSERNQGIKEKPVATTIGSLLCLFML